MAALTDFNLFGPDAQRHIDLMNLKSQPKGPDLLGIDFCHLNNTVGVRNAAVDGVVPRPLGSVCKGQGMVNLHLTEQFRRFDTCS